MSASISALKTYKPLYQQITDLRGLTCSAGSSCNHHTYKNGNKMLPLPLLQSQNVLLLPREENIPVVGTRKHKVNPASSRAPAQPIPKANAEGLLLTVEMRQGRLECPPASSFRWDLDAGRVDERAQRLCAHMASTHQQKQGGACSSVAKL